MSNKVILRTSSVESLESKASILSMQTASEGDDIDNSDINNNYKTTKLLSKANFENKTQKQERPQ